MGRMTAMSLAAVMALAAGAWAEEIPWKTEAPAVTATEAPAVTATETPAVTGTLTGTPAVTATPARTATAAPAPTGTHAVTPTPAVTPTSSGPELTPDDIWGTSGPTTKVTSLAGDAKFARAVKPIEDQIALVGKLQDLYDKELTKPEAQRNPTLLRGYKTNIAQGFLKASGTAKMAEAQFPKAEDKKQIADAYEMPLRARCVSVYLEMAGASMTRRDYRDAGSLYRMILQIDAKNQAAMDGLKKIEELSRPAGAPITGGGGTSGMIMTVVPH